ncbi:MAG: hypothetical protein ACRDTG_15005 [Pseudonocardiaceae bacterium]
MDWPQLREEIITTTARVSDLLRALPDGELPLSRVSWSVAELGAHRVSLPRRYHRMAQTPQPFPASPYPQHAHSDTASMLVSMLEVHGAG